MTSPTTTANNDDEFDFDLSDDDFDDDDDYEYDSDEDAELYKPKEVKPEMTAEELAEYKRQLRERLDEELAGLHSAARRKRSKKLPWGRGEKLLMWKNSVNHQQLNSWEARHVRVPEAGTVLSEYLDDSDVGVEDNSYFGIKPADLGIDDAASGSASGNDSDANVGSADATEAVPEGGLMGDELEAAVLAQAGMPGDWFDEKRERRAVKLALLKRRGKGPPKKGSGKRSKK